MMRRIFLIATMLCCLTGCWSRPVSEEYGPVKGRESTDSLNGLGVHREFWEHAGARCFSFTKLSPRLSEVDVILLVGTSHAPPGKLARDWLVKWAAEQEGRTVVYFGRDFNAATYYLRHALGTIAPDLRPQAFRQIAQREIEDLASRVSEIPENIFAEWFYLDVQRRTNRYQQFRGPWSNDLAGLAGEWPVRSVLYPPSPQWKSHPPSWLREQDAAASSSVAAYRENGSDDVETPQRSKWTPDEFATRRDWDQAFEQLLSSHVLLEATDGTPLVFELPIGRHQESKILILANGAPLLNGSAVEPLHRKINQKLIAACQPARRVAMVTYGSSGLLVSNVPERDRRGMGLEMLTVWPLSAITMTFALVGILLCVALFPILGRPRRLPLRTVSDFGLHVEAVGQLLKRIGAEEFAQRALRDYFVIVRNEPPPEWLAANDQRATVQSPESRARSLTRQPEEEPPVVTPDVSASNKTP